jgi:16S rRNA processing protein RimM
MIAIGRIIKPHGVKGTLKIKSDTDFKTERFKPGSVLTLTGIKPQTVTVKSYALKPNMELIEFENITDRDQALALVGSTIEIDESLQEPLSGDEFYFTELMDYTVIHEGVSVGQVIDVMDYPQGAMLRVQTAEKTVLIPFLKAFVSDVDRTLKTLTLVDWDGLL